jgi:hypothetical protein
MRATGVGGQKVAAGAEGQTSEFRLGCVWAVCGHPSERRAAGQGEKELGRVKRGWVEDSRQREEHVQPTRFGNPAGTGSCLIVPHSDLHAFAADDLLLSLSAKKKIQVRRSQEGG